MATIFFFVAWRTRVRGEFGARGCVGGLCLVLYLLRALALASLLPDIARIASAFTIPLPGSAPAVMPRRVPRALALRLPVLQRASVRLRRLFHFLIQPRVIRLRRFLFHLLLICYFTISFFVPRGFSFFLFVDFHFFV